MRNRACAARVSRLSHMLELADRLVGIYKTRDVTKSVTMCVATPRPLRARDRPRPLCACSAPSPRGKACNDGVRAHLASSRAAYPNFPFRSNPKAIAADAAAVEAASAGAGAGVAGGGLSARARPRSLSAPS